MGRDVLSRIIYGARVSLVVGLAATSVNMVVALLIGTTTGFFGGKLDMVVQRFVDAWMAFPGLLILITVMSLVGQGLLQTILVLGITGGIGGSRIARSAVIGIRENVYLQAADRVGRIFHQSTESSVAGISINGARLCPTRKGEAQ